MLYLLVFPTGKAWFAFAVMDGPGQRRADRGQGTSAARAPENVAGERSGDSQKATLSGRPLTPMSPARSARRRAARTDHHGLEASCAVRKLLHSGPSCTRRARPVSVGSLRPLLATLV